MASQQETGVMLIGRVDAKRRLGKQLEARMKRVGARIIPHPLQRAPVGYQICVVATSQIGTPESAKLHSAFANMDVMSEEGLDAVLRGAMGWREAAHHPRYALQRVMVGEGCWGANYAVDRRALAVRSGRSLAMVLEEAIAGLSPCSAAVGF